MERDPIKIYRIRLSEFGVSESEIAAIEQQSRRKVEEATAVCRASPPAPLELLTANVYADGGWAWRN
jgi:pyruvate dehydrogenase E1 component alpha subunit